MNRQAGFGLVEVIIAFIVVAVTAGSLLQLNKVYLEYGRDGRNREVALRLAESKLDELRGFTDLAGYQAIGNGSELTPIDEVDYTLTWTVTDYGWSGGWVTPPPLGKSSGKKDIAVKVAWTDASGPQSFSISSVVSPALAIKSGPFGTGASNVGLGLGGPTINHTPGQLPTVVPIELGGGLKKETSRPQPTVTKVGQSESIRVSFDTVTYDGSSNTKKQQQKQVSVSCDCKISTGSSTVPRLPARHILSNGQSYWVAGATDPLKQQGVVADNKQDALCDRCCAHHFDGSSSDFSNWYDVFKWFAGSGPHAHYAGTPGNFTLASGNNAPYLEACRVVRTAGFYEVATDWNLVALNVFGAGVLNDSAVLAAYQSYVKEVVIEYVRSQVKAGSNFNQSYYVPKTFSSYLDEQNISPETTNLTVELGPRQLMARGIYVDMLSAQYRQQLLDEVMGGNADASLSELLNSALLRSVPFDEVNLTLLADWTSSNATGVAVTSQPVQTVVDVEAQYYGVYSRGLLDAKTAGATSTLTATIRRSNSGITTEQAISQVEVSDTRSSSMLITVQGAPPYSTVSGKLNCVEYYFQGNQWKQRNCTSAQFGKIAVNNTNIESSQQLCRQTTSGQGSNLTTNYSCKATPGTSANLTVTLTGAGYQAFPPASPWAVTVPSGASSSVAGGCLVVTINKPASTATPQCN